MSHPSHAEFPEFTIDTRKVNCPIRIMYTEVTGNSLHAHELDTRPWGLRPVRPLAVINATEHGDYVGSDVEASNCRAMWDLEDMRPHLVQICGSHGYKALAYDATLGPVPDSWALALALAGFEHHYPVFDDDDHNALKAELEGEAWESFGRRDFVKALDDVLDYVDPQYGHDGGDLADGQRIPDVLRKALESMGVGTAHPDDATWDEFYTWLWHIGCDVVNVNGGSGHIIETGCVVHFYLHEWAKGVRDMKRTNPSVQRGRFQLVLTELAKVCRTDEASDGALEYPEGSGG